MFRRLFLSVLFAYTAFAQNADTTEAYIAKLTARAIENFPLNKAAKSRLELAKENVSLANLSWFNNVNLSYQYNPNNSNASSGSALPLFGVGLSVNLGNVMSTPGRIRQAGEEVNIAQADFDNQINYVRAEVIRRYTNYKRSLDILVIRMQSVYDSESSMLFVKKGFESGEVSLEIYNQALRNYTDNLERKVVAEGDVTSSKATLEELIGGKL